MPAIYKGEDVRIEVKLPKAFSAYSERKGYLIFPTSTGAFQLKSAALDGAALVNGTTPQNDLPVAVFTIPSSLTKIDDGGAGLHLISNTTGYLEVRLKEVTLFDILIVPVGPIINTNIKSLA